MGRPGRQIINQQLPALVRQRQIDFVIANAENIAGGSGITTKLFQKIRSYGVDVVTLGDHVYRRSDIVPMLQTSERIVRPANISVSCRRPALHHRADAGRDSDRCLRGAGPASS